MTLRAYLTRPLFLHCVFQKQFLFVFEILTLKSIESLNEFEVSHKEKDKRSAIFDHLHHCIQFQTQNSNIYNKFKVLKRCARDGLCSLNQYSLKKKNQN